MHIMHDRTYRLSFFGALLLHIIVAVFLSIEMASLKRQAVTSNNVNIIKAFAVSASEVASSMRQAEPSQTIPPSEPHAVVQEKAPKAPVPEVKEPISHPKLPTTTISKNALKQKMQKSMLQEETKEAQLTQKKVQEQKQVLEKLKHLKQQQALQKLLHGELANESKQLKQQSQKSPAASAASTGGAQTENIKNTAGGALTQKDQSEIDKYKALIIQALASEWIIPQGVEKNDMCKLIITLGPGGAVLDIKVIQSSKNPLLLRATQAAIWKASPLPIPKESSLFPNFRTIQLTARPEGMTEE